MYCMSKNDDQFYVVSYNIIIEEIRRMTRIMQMDIRRYR